MEETSGPNEQWPLHNVVAAMIDLSRIFERLCGHSYNDHHKCVGCTRRSECQEWETLSALLQGKARELKELGDEVDVRRRESADGAWYWQGDEWDHPESLVCPVIMSAETLRGHLAQLAENDKTIAELRKRTHETAHKRDKREAQMQSELAGWHRMRDEVNAYIGDRMHSGECRLDWFACVHFMAERDEAKAHLAVAQDACRVAVDMADRRGEYNAEECRVMLAKLRAALAADAGKAVTEDEIEEAAAQEIKKQLAAGAGKGW